MYRVTAHPRSRGENTPNAASSGSTSGSSPLTRGKHVARYFLSDHVGLIPAHAGKTHEAATVADMSSGSSPLTRGKPCGRQPSGAMLRLIPAHAGKTEFAADRPSVLQAHPRSRGENNGCLAVDTPHVGSSPLTRGKHAEELAHLEQRRLIPAHAGKTARACSRCPGWRAHPRSRGENREPTRTLQRTCGSSPLTRGKPRVGLGALHRRGLIPAHAGKTRSTQSDSRSPPAHPRSRGENGPGVQPVSPLAGSSPLTRGKRRGDWGGSCLFRLIPAHAGKTSERIR